MRCAGTARELQTVLPAAERLLAVMTDPERGLCEPLRIDGLSRPGLLDDPTFEEAEKAIGEALQQCARKGQTLFLACLGHGEVEGDAYFLQARNTDPDKMFKTSVELIREIKTVVLGQDPKLDSLILLLDTCSSGGAVEQAAATLIKNLKGQTAFEVLAATTAGAATYNCRVTNALVDVVERGLPESRADVLYLDQIKAMIEKTEGADLPQYVGFSGTSWHEGLWFARNYGCARVNQALALAEAADRASGRAIYDRAVRLAVLACKVTGPGFVVPEARSALLKAASANPLLSIQQGKPEEKLADISRMDSKLLLAKIGDTVSVRNIFDGSLLASLKHAAPVDWARFDGSGRRAITVSGADTVCIWDLETYQPVSPARKIPAPLAGASGMSKWRIIAVCENRPELCLGVCFRKSAWLFNLSEDRRKSLGSGLAHLEDITSAAFSPDGRLVVTTAWGGEAKVWDVASAEQREVLKHAKVVWCAAFSPDGRKVVTGSDDLTARIWDVSQNPSDKVAMAMVAASLGNKIKTTTESSVGLPIGAEVSCVSFSMDGNTVIVGDRAGRAQIWSIFGGDPLNTPLWHDEIVRRAVLLGENRVGTISGNTVRIGRAGNQILTIRPSSGDRHIEEIGVHQNRFLAGYRDGVARLWNAETGELLGQTRKDDMDINLVRLAASRVVTASEKEAQVWDMEFRPIGHRLTHEDTILALRMSPDGDRVLTASHDGKVRLWQVETGELVGELLAFEYPCFEACFSRDGTRLATATANTVAIWRSRDGQPLASPITLGQLEDGQLVNATIIAFSPGGELLITASDTNVAQLWDVLTGRVVGAPLQHFEPISAVSFSPDGMFVLTASSDGAARIWAATTGKLAVPPMRHPDALKAALFSPDGQLILTCCSDGLARVWDTNGRLLGDALAPRNDMILSANFVLDGSRVLTSTRDSFELWDLKYHRLSAGELITRLGESLPPETQILRRDDIAAAWPIEPDRIGENVFN
jgi:WD40 repeat protein